jgi:hypothetical protein
MSFKSYLSKYNIKTDFLNSLNMIVIYIIIRYLFIYIFMYDFLNRCYMSLNHG